MESLLHPTTTFIISLTLTIILISSLMPTVSIKNTMSPTTGTPSISPTKNPTIFNPTLYPTSSHVPVANTHNPSIANVEYEDVTYSPVTSQAPTSSTERLIIYRTGRLVPLPPNRQDATNICLNAKPPVLNCRNVISLTCYPYGDDLVNLPANYSFNPTSLVYGPPPNYIQFSLAGGYQSMFQPNPTVTLLNTPRDVGLNWFNDYKRALTACNGDGTFASTMSCNNWDPTATTGYIQSSNDADGPVSLTDRWITAHQTPCNYANGIGITVASLALYCLCVQGA